MGISNKFLASGTIVAAFAIAPIAYSAGGATVTTTPSHVKAGKSVEMMIKGMKPNEAVKAVESIPSTGQSRTLHPRAGRGGSLIVKVRAQVKGKHIWTFTGRSSHRTVKTHYVVT